MADRDIVVAGLVLGLVALVVVGGLFALALTKGPVPAGNVPTASQPIPVFSAQQAPFIPPQDQPVEYTAPVPMLAYDQGTRVAMTGPGRKYLSWRSPFTGWLVGVTVFTSAVDAGDTYGITLKGRTLKSNIYAVANTSQAEGFSEPINAGDTIMLFYDSQGSTSKNVDMTPRVQYSPSQNPGA